MKVSNKSTDEVDMVRENFFQAGKMLIVTTIG